MGEEKFFYFSFIYGGEAFFHFKLMCRRKLTGKITPVSILFMSSIIMNFSDILLL